MEWTLRYGLFDIKQRCWAWKLRHLWGGQFFLCIKFCSLSHWYIKRLLDMKPKFIQLLYKLARQGNACLLCGWGLLNKIFILGFCPKVTRGGCQSVLTLISVQSWLTLTPSSVFSVLSSVTSVLRFVLSVLSSVTSVLSCVTSSTLDTDKWLSMVFLP